MSEAGQGFGECALLTVAEMASADRLAMEGGVAGATLMENAGRGVADIAHQARPGARAVVLCGPGNNGGDGFVAARHLHAMGHNVQLYLLGTEGALKGDAAGAARTFKGAGGHVLPLASALAEPGDLVIDALFGAGLSRPLDGAAAQAVRRVNAIKGAHIIAVDIPSGVQGDTGKALGIAIEAQETVTFFRAKPGHFLMPGRAHCGRLHVIDIGIPAQILERLAPRNARNGPPLWAARFPRPAMDGHKYKRGHVVVVSGPASMTGAARLAARGALRVGAGLVTVASPPDALIVNAAHLTAIMVRVFDGQGEFAALLADPRKNAVVLGPGLGVGQESIQLVRIAQDAGPFLVLDADAITSFAERPASLWINARKPMVLTPHEGEFERLFPGLLAEAGDKLSAARKAAQRSCAVIVLKGPDTVIAEPNGAAVINANAPPTLATAGSGDVLAGLIAGLGAQGLPAFEAASAGVWLQGAAASAFGPGLIAEDIPEMLPGVLKDLAETLARGESPMV
jgi:hydroxyethylthiazole kinase-like uncharacterized protein yjeF